MLSDISINADADRRARLKKGALYLEQSIVF